MIVVTADKLSCLILKRWKVRIKGVRQETAMQVFFSCLRFSFLSRLNTINYSY